MLQSNERTYRFTVPEELRADFASVLAILRLVLTERQYQDAKYGPLDERPLPMSTWLKIMEHELDEAKQALLVQHDVVACRAEVMQVIAVGWAMQWQYGPVPGHAAPWQAEPE